MRGKISTDDHTLLDRGAELLKPDRGRGSIPRVVSLLVLLAVLVFTGVLFFRVMAIFVVPLFLACVMVVVFEPVFKWINQRCGNRTPLAAVLTTLLISLLVLAPCAFLGWSALAEINTIVAANAQHTEPAPEIPDQPGAVGPVPPDEPQNEDAAQNVMLWEANWDNLPEESKLTILADWYQMIFRERLTNARVDELKGQAVRALRHEGQESVLVGLKVFASTVLGLVVMLVATYYFFADGPAMVTTLMHLSPLDDRYEKQLLERFSEVSRAVVVSILLSAVAQAILAGVGFWFTLSDKWPLSLLVFATGVLSMVPFLGSAAVWGLVSVILFFQGETTAAIGLAIYGATIVSTADNIIKPLVLHGQSNLHPLLALLSVLGGVTVLGPIGILVGPILVAFLQTLLMMLRKELDSLQDEFGAASDPDQLAQEHGGDAPPPQPDSAAASTSAGA